MVQQTDHRLVDRHQTHVPHDLGEEAAVDEVQDGMGDAPDVLVDRKPESGRRGIERGPIVPRVRVAVEVPGRVDKGVHGVGLAARRLAAPGARNSLERLRSRQRRATFPAESDIVGKQDRKVLFGNGNDAALRAMNHRDGSSPVALPGDAPVANPELDHATGEPFLLAQPGQRFQGFGAGHSAVSTRVYKHARLRVGPVIGDRHGRIRGSDHGADRKVVELREVMVPRVVPGNGHDGPGAVLHQDEVSNPDGNPLARVGILRVAPREQAFLPLPQEGLRVGHVPLQHPGHELGDRPLLRGVRGEPSHRGVFGRQHAKCGAENSVQACREDFQRLHLGNRQNREFHQRSLASTDPVLLHLPYPVGPPGKLRKIRVQIFGIGGDL